MIGLTNNIEEYHTWKKKRTNNLDWKKKDEIRNYLIKVKMC